MDEAEIIKTYEVTSSSMRGGQMSLVIGQDTMFYIKHSKYTEGYENLGDFVSKELIKELQSDEIEIYCSFLQAAEYFK